MLKQLYASRSRRPQQRSQLLGLNDNRRGLQERYMSTTQRRQRADTNPNLPVPTDPPKPKSRDGVTSRHPNKSTWTAYSPASHSRQTSPDEYLRMPAILQRPKATTEVYHSSVVVCSKPICSFYFPPIPPSTPRTTSRLLHPTR